MYPPTYNNNTNLKINNNFMHKNQANKQNVYTITWKSPMCNNSSVNNFIQNWIGNAFHVYKKINV